MTPAGQSPPEIRIPLPGPRSRELGERLARAESPSVASRRSSRAEASGEPPTPVVFARGEGSNLFDVDGNRYVDLAAGFGALLLGHAPAVLRSALEDQASRLWLALGDVFGSDAKVDLCERLAGLHPEPGARVLLGSSGADAVTAALKTAVLATGKSGVVAFVGGYHGLSHGPLAACGLDPRFRAPFSEQLGTQVAFAPYPADEAGLDRTLVAVRAALAKGDVGCVLVEPILGRGGCTVPPHEFLPGLRAACDAFGALLACDEIWTGLGRSGSWLAGSVDGALPDLVCLGKGLGGGLPLSACIGSARVMEPWGKHGGAAIHTATHFGSPLVCAVGLALLNAVESESLPTRATELGGAWMARIRERTQAEGVADVRGRGLMVGVELEGGAVRTLAVANRLLRRGWVVLTGGVRGNVLTLTPPLNVHPDLLEAFVDALVGTLRQAHRDD